MIMKLQSNVIYKLTIYVNFWQLFKKFQQLEIPGIEPGALHIYNRGNIQSEGATTALYPYLLLMRYQRDGIYRVGILEHFLPKSKQTPKPLISKES